MALFKFLISPYTKAIGTIGTTAKNLVGMGRQLKSNVERMVEENKTAGTLSAKEIIEAKDSTEAFEKLYVANGWTPERLETQARTVRRTKWLSLLACWIAFCLSIGIGIYSGLNFFSLLSIGSTLLLALFFAVSMVRFALFQTQIQTRSILSFKEFLSRPDFFIRLFS